MKQEAQVHILPTEDKGVLLKGVYPYDRPPLELLPTNDKEWLKFGKPQHLYFTSDEQPKYGDWCIDSIDNNYVFKLYKDFIENNPNYIKYCRKIVATTDKSLRGNLNFIEYTQLRKRRNTLRDNSKDWGHLEYSTALRQIKQWDIELSNYENGVKEVPQQFIEEYVKAGGIDEVLLEYEKYQIKAFAGGEGIRLKTDQNNYVIIHPIEPKLYTREEIKTIIDNTYKDLELKVGNDIEFNGCSWLIELIKENLK